MTRVRFLNKDNEILFENKGWYLGFLAEMLILDERKFRVFIPNELTFKKLILITAEELVNAEDDDIIKLRSLLNVITELYIELKLFNNKTTMEVTKC